MFKIESDNLHFLINIILSFNFIIYFLFTITMLTRESFQYQPTVQTDKTKKVTSSIRVT